MNWLVVHSREAYNQHNDLIGLPVKIDPATGKRLMEGGKLVPRYEVTNKIKKDDIVIYYIKRPESAFLGIFKIIEGPGIYTEDWRESIHFRILPILVPDKPLPVQETLKKLEIFKDVDTETSSSWAMKLRTSIIQISDDDASFLKQEMVRLHREEPKIDPSHILMISKTDGIVQLWSCYSFVGRIERSRIQTEGNELNLDSLPGWMEDIGKEIKQLRKLELIDNIWFYSEKGGLLIPVLVVEHETGRANLRGILDRFLAVSETLQTNRRFQDVTPTFIIVTKDNALLEETKRRLSKDGSWVKFRAKHELEVIDLPSIEHRSDRFLTIINNALKRTRT